MSKPDTARAHLLSARGGDSSVSRADQVSQELLEIAEAGLREGQHFTYKGKRLRNGIIKVSSKEYAQFVVDVRKYRRQACIQISSRVCQLVAFVLTAVAVAIGTWSITLLFGELNDSFLGDASQLSIKLRPALTSGQLQKVVQDLSGVVGGLRKGVDTVGEVVSGVSNVTDVITEGGGRQYVADVVQNASSVVEPALQDLSAAGNTIGESISNVISGNSTLQEGLSSVGSAFTDFGNNLVSGLQTTGNQIAEASTEIFCGALSFFCTPPSRSEPSGRGG